MTRHVSFPSLCITCLVLIASCGGGGGSSTPGKSPNPTPTPAADTVAPSVQLLNTPSGKNTVDTSTIILSGIATDNLDIEFIRVNGQVPTERFSLNATNSGRTIEWSVEKSLDLGENLFEVTASDSTGNTSAPESVTIHRTYITPTVLFDSPSQDEWIGYYHQYGLSDVLRFDKNTLDARETSRLSRGYNLTIDKLSANEDTVYSATFSGTSSTLTITATDINTNKENILETIQLDANPDLWSWVGVFHSGYRASDNSYYILISYYPIDDGTKQRTILKYGIDDRSIEYIINGSFDSDPAFEPNSFAVSENYILAYNAAGNSALTKIDPIDGSQTVLVENIAGALTIMAIDSTETFVYGLNYSFATKINLVTLEVEYFSYSQNQDFFNFSGPKSITIDEINNRLLVVEPYLEKIITIDIDSGERGSLLNNYVGDGRTFTNPTDMVVTQDKQTAYVSDRVQHVPSAIFEVDLQSGNRTEITDMPWDISTVNPSSLALDDNRKHLFIATSDSIAQANLISGERTIIASAAVGSGEPISAIESIEYDSVTQTLLILESTKIISLNVNTLVRVTLFNDLAEGSTALSFDHANNRLLLLNNSLGVFSIDLETEIVSTLASECVNQSNANIIIESTASYGSIAYNANKNTLLIANDSLIEYDVDSGACTTEGILIRAAVYDNDNTAIMTTERGVALRDLITGQNYILSR